MQYHQSLSLVNQLNWFYNPIKTRLWYLDLFNCYFGFLSHIFQFLQEAGSLCSLNMFKVHYDVCALRLYWQFPWLLTFLSNHRYINFWSMCLTYFDAQYVLRILCIQGYSTSNIQFFLVSSLLFLSSFTLLFVSIYLLI